jgi:CARDB
MRRAALVITLFALGLPVAAQAQAPQLRARLAACQSGPAAAQRTATFVGSMPAVAGTKRMWMRFDLYARLPPATVYSALKVPKLGVWQKSAPGKASSGFVFTQRVQALAAPGSYKALVRFRWYDRAGRLLRSTTRSSRVCKQPDQRADLRAGTLDAVRGPQPDEATYQLDVRNDGHTAAGPFDVVLSVGGVEQPAQRVIGGLAPAATATVTFVAPRCAAGSTLRFVLDAEDEVEESGEADDVVERACPLT